ncbi:MAG: formylglycine-generating enzyme family protein [Pirellula sp.]
MDRLSQIYRIVSISVAYLVFGFANHSQASIVSFGASGNTFTIDFADIGSAGNAADTTGSPAGSGDVNYGYAISRYEISEAMITRYNASFGNANNLAISTSNRGPDRPATNVSWNEAARFVNWLNTSTGGFAAYKFTGSGVNANIAMWTPSDTLDYDATNPFRSIRANYVLPTIDEWYKAAFFDPVTQTYNKYANGGNTKPTMVGSGTGANTAVYHRTYPGNADEPAAVNQAGSANSFGVTGMGGNAWEWLETESDGTNNSPSSARRYRGGSWASGDFSLSSASNGSFDLPTQSLNNVGFRVVALLANNLPAPSPTPEPTSLAIAVVFGGLAFAARRKRQA